MIKRLIGCHQVPINIQLTKGVYRAQVTKMCSFKKIFCSNIPNQSKIGED